MVAHLVLVSIFFIHSETSANDDFAARFGCYNVKVDSYWLFSLVILFVLTVAFFICIFYDYFYIGWFSMVSVIKQWNTIVCKCMCSVSAALVTSLWDGINSATANDCCMLGISIEKRVNIY
jgi:hypothetical protein